MTEYVVQGISFADDRVEVVYAAVPGAVRAEGNLMRTSVLTIARGADWDDEIEDILDALKALLADAIEDFDGTEEFSFEEAARQADGLDDADDDDDDD